MNTNDLNKNETGESTQKIQKASKNDKNSFSSVDKTITFVLLIIGLLAIIVYLFSISAGKNRDKDNYYLTFESYESKSDETIIVFKRENKMWHTTEHTFYAEDFSLMVKGEELKGSSIKSSDFYPSDKKYEWVNKNISVVDGTISIRFEVKKEDVDIPITIYYLGQKFKIGQKVNYKS